jgi:hypothetical protein
MFRATGPGQVEVIADGVGYINALLYNFDFDDFAEFKYRELKAAHATFLEDKVVPLLANDRGNIWMEGSASKIGTKAWNMDLSRTRVGRVATFLSTRDITMEQMQLDAVGEERAQKHGEDDPRDRGVQLWVLPKLPTFPPIPLPRRVPPKPSMLSRHFKISMVAGLSVSQALNAGKFLKVPKIGAGVAVDGLFFAIWDTDNNIAMLYFYFGIGLGVGFTIMPKVSATEYGPWTAFTTEKPMACFQFGPDARFTTAGVGSQTVNWITMETPPGINDVKSLSISTGTTLGAGMSFTPISELFKVSHPYRFNGH